MSEQALSNAKFEVIIAGNGMPGILAANRLCQTMQNSRILLIDMADDPRTGGDSLADKVQPKWQSQPHFISSEILNFIEKSYSLEPDLSMSTQIGRRKISTAAIYSAKSFHQLPLDKIFSHLGAKILGGSAAEKEWSKLEGIINENTPNSTSEQSISRLWKDGKKSPALTALKHLSYFYGITDIWRSPIQAIRQRANFLQSGLYSGVWGPLLADLLSFPAVEDRLVSLFSCRIIDAKRGDDHWTLQTEKGIFRGDKLLVAQAPWDTFEWLDRSSAPLKILNLALKSKPTSVVSLCTTPQHNPNIDHLIYLPSEEVQVLQINEGSLCYLATIDYESSLQAPVVTKAIKRLKRARKKLESILPKIKSDSEHFALVPIAWPQSATVVEKRLIQNLKDQSSFQKHHLGFCGDCYGDSYSPDLNLLRSLISSCAAMSESEDSLPN